MTISLCTAKLNDRDRLSIVNPAVSTDVKREMKFVFSNREQSKPSFIPCDKLISCPRELLPPVSTEHIVQEFSL